MTRSVRAIRIESDTAFIPLSRGYEAMIDAADINLAKGLNWRAMGCDQKIYAARNEVAVDGKIISVLLHRKILGAAKGLEVDHISGNTLDNRRSNLRLATHAQNLRNRGANSNNTSGFKGVCWTPSKRKWRAAIKVDGRQKHLGYFSEPDIAHKAYCKAASELHGEFARVA